jgi:dienelactone hydrolase
MKRALACTVVLIVSFGTAAAWIPPRQADPVADAIARIDSRVLSAASGEELKNMLPDHARKGLSAANQRSTDQWARISNRQDWENFSREKLAALRSSLGTFPERPGSLTVRATRTIPGEGFAIENLVFESRPGLWVTANLYRPEPVRASMPGILLCHSHHNPKTQGELQDMGMTWARAGCLVLVMDQLGHGERRQHPFVSEQDYPAEFPVGRQDYHFRYNTAIQLQLIGDSLMGWMVWDLRRGVDLMLSRPGIDPRRIVLMGSVAGGGDPAAVAAALDDRIAAAVPFNFGGPQPESPYPLPADAENVFAYAGSGDWETTRNLSLSCRDGFLPWVIVGSIAPRKLVYAHEFSWDREHDPVWKRLQHIYADFYGAPRALDYTTGFGLLQGRPPQASHCNNVGPPHRERIHAALQRWFGVQCGPSQEYQKRLPPEELQCMTAAVAQELKPQPLRVLARRIGQERVSKQRDAIAALSTSARRKVLESEWRALLGNVEPGTARVVTSGTTSVDDVAVERLELETEPGVSVPAVILTSGATTAPRPVVMAISYEGKTAFLKAHTAAVADLLRGGAAVCLPDLRGTGETSPDGARGRMSTATGIAATELMLGETVTGARIRDMRAVLAFLRTRRDFDRGRIALWGDSSAPVNAPGTDLRVPLGAPKEPPVSAPDGALLVLLGSLLETDVRAVLARGGLTAFESVLDSQFCYLPYDAVIPGALKAGDLADVAASLAPRPLRLEAMVDGLNRRADLRSAQSAYEPARRAYQNAGAAGNFLVTDPAGEAELAAWLLKSLESGVTR